MKWGAVHLSDVTLIGNDLFDVRICVYTDFASNYGNNVHCKSSSFYRTCQLVKCVTCWKENHYTLQSFGGIRRLETLIRQSYETVNAQLAVGHANHNSTKSQWWRQQIHALKWTLGMISFFSLIMYVSYCWRIRRHVKYICNFHALNISTDVILTSHECHGVRNHRHLEICPAAFSYWQ